MSAMDVPIRGPRGATAATHARPVAAAGVPKLSWVTLAFMTTASVASLRAAPTMAVYGLACVFLYAVPAIVFLLPTALVSAELASGWDGGVYNWVARGISKPAAPLLITLCVVGFIASLAALFIGFVPPSQFGGGSLWSYLLIVAGGALGLGLLVPFLFYRLRKPSWRLDEPTPAEVS